MSKRKVIGIGVGLMMIGFIVGICMMMFIVKTNPKKEYEERKRYGTLLEYEESLSQLEQENDTLQKEKQPYAENAYNLGKAEYWGVTVMKPEEAAKFQEDIQEVINSSLTLEEQEKRVEQILQTLQEYITGEEESSENGMGLWTNKRGTSLNKRCSFFVEKEKIYAFLRNKKYIVELEEHRKLIMKGDWSITFILHFYYV